MNGGAIQEGAGYGGDKKRVNGANGGPSWKWLNGILLSIVGMGVGAWMLSVSSQQSTQGTNLANINRQMQQMQDQQAANRAQQESIQTQLHDIWQQMKTNEAIQTDLTYRLKALESDSAQQERDHNLLHNWTHPDRSTR